MNKRRELQLPSLFDDSFFPTLLRNFTLFDDRPQSASNIGMWDDETHVYVEAALPGVSEKDIKLTYNKGVLWVEGSCEESEGEKRKYFYKRSSHFSYNIAIPGEIDEGVDPKATYKNGILTVVFAKKKEEVPRKIQITVNK